MYKRIEFEFAINDNEKMSNLKDIISQFDIDYLLDNGRYELKSIFNRELKYKKTFIDTYYINGENIKDIIIDGIFVNQYNNHFAVIQVPKNYTFDIYISYFLYNNDFSITKIKDLIIEFKDEDEFMLFNPLMEFFYYGTNSTSEDEIFLTLLEENNFDVSKEALFKYNDLIETEDDLLIINEIKKQLGKHLKIPNTIDVKYILNKIDDIKVIENKFTLLLDLIKNNDIVVDYFEKNLIQPISFYEIKETGLIEYFNYPNLIKLKTSFKELEAIEELLNNKNYKDIVISTIKNNNTIKETLINLIFTYSYSIDSEGDIDKLPILTQTIINVTINYLQEEYNYCQKNNIPFDNSKKIPLKNFNLQQGDVVLSLLNYPEFINIEFIVKEINFLANLFKFGKEKIAINLLTYSKKNKIGLIEKIFYNRDFYSDNYKDLLILAVEFLLELIENEEYIVDYDTIYGMYFLNKEYKLEIDDRLNYILEYNIEDIITSFLEAIVLNDDGTKIRNNNDIKNKIKEANLKKYGAKDNEDNEDNSDNLEDEDNDEEIDNGNGLVLDLDVDFIKSIIKQDGLQTIKEQADYLNLLDLMFLNIIDGQEIRAEDIIDENNYKRLIDFYINNKRDLDKYIEMGENDLNDIHKRIMLLLLNYDIEYIILNLLAKINGIHLISDILNILVYKINNSIENINKFLNELIETNNQITTYSQHIFEVKNKLEKTIIKENSSLFEKMFYIDIFTGKSTKDNSNILEKNKQQLLELYNKELGDIEEVSKMTLEKNQNLAESLKILLEYKVEMQQIINVFDNIIDVVEKSGDKNALFIISNINKSKMKFIEFTKRFNLQYDTMEKMIMKNKEDLNYIINDFINLLDLGKFENSINEIKF